MTHLQACIIHTNIMEFHDSTTNHKGFIVPPVNPMQALRKIAMKYILNVLFLALFTLSMATGCFEEKKAGIDAKTDMALVKSALKKAERAHNPQTRIKHLRFAHDLAEQLPRWPNAEKVPEFLGKHGAAIKRIPNQVYELSLRSRDMESFKWAAERSNATDLLQYSELKRIWKMGKQWRDYYLSEYPEQTLSIFMSEAANDYSVRFLNQYLGDFKADGYRLEFPLENTEFFSRFCRFLADMIEQAIHKEDQERICFLIDHMPKRTSVSQIDLKTEETMRLLGDYVCYELKDEALACKMVELGYDMNRVDIEKAGFGSEFAKALAADLEHTVFHVLKLNEWHGVLSEREIRFLLFLPDPVLRLVDKRYIDQATEASIKDANNNEALRLVEIREEIEPFTLHGYDQLLAWSLQYKNRDVFNHVKSKCSQIDIYRVDLAQLGENWNLFRLHAPKIFRKIYRTMDTLPKKDGTTYGRIRGLLRSHCPEAALHVVKNHDLEGQWTEMTGGHTVLMDVCEGGNLKAAKYLVEEKGADVNAATKFIAAETTVFGRTRSKEGRLTPMFFAAKSGNSELVEYLASKGATIDARSNFGATPLMYAVSHNHLDVVETLIKLGVDVNLAMTGNLNPSDFEEEGMDAGENISNAYRRARKNGNEEMLAILKKAGAKP